MFVNSCQHARRYNSSQPRDCSSVVPVRYFCFLENSCVQNVTRTTFPTSCFGRALGQQRNRTTTPAVADAAVATRLTTAADIAFTITTIFYYYYVY